MNLLSQQTKKGATLKLIQPVCTFRLFWRCSVLTTSDSWQLGALSLVLGQLELVVQQQLGGLLSFGS
jgi:hypothetical protein